MHARLCCIAVLAAFPSLALAESADLEERIRRLELRAEAAGDAPEPPGDGALGVWFDEGLTFSAADGRFEATVGGYLIHHSTFALRENERATVDTFAINEAGIVVTGTLDEAWEVYVQWRILPDGSDLYLATASFVKWDWLTLRAGVITEPYSMELQEYNQWIDVPTYSMASLTTPDIDLGAMAEGSLFDGTLSYAIGAFNGNGAAAGADENSDKDVCARLVLRPFATGGPEILNRLWIGGCAMGGRARRAPGETPFAFESTATGTVFLADPGGPPAFRVDGGLQRFNAEIAWLPGPFEFKAEVDRVRARIEFDGRGEHWNAESHYVSVGFWLGGERDPGARPTVEKALFDGGAGAFQFVARYTQIHLGEEFINDAGFVGTNHAREYAAAVNWYPNAMVRVSLMYALLEYGSERVPLGGRLIDDEDVLIVRTQIDF